MVECSLIFCEPLFVIHEGFAMKQSGLLLVSLYCSAGGGFTHLNNPPPDAIEAVDRKSTRLNSSHGYISYAVFCLKKRKEEGGGGGLII